MTVDKKLLKRLINADETAFKQIFDLYVPKVYQFIYDYIKERTEAEDLTQMVFIKIWEYRGNIDIDKSFEGYIFTIAHRNVLDHIKKKATRERQITSPLSEGVQLISTLTAEDFIIKHQFDSVYYRAIESLPSKRKEIFILSRHNGMSNSEIAKQLDLSIKTVENQMTAAIASLKEFFKLSELGLIPFFYFFF